jgi:hypothetical protein
MRRRQRSFFFLDIVVMLLSGGTRIHWTVDVSTVHGASSNPGQGGARQLSIFRRIARRLRGNCHLPFVDVGRIIADILCSTRGACGRIFA